jgi:hypothetical protein
MKLYLVIEYDADPYCGYYVIGVFSTRLIAVEFIQQNKKQYSPLEIIERELDVVVAE